jgi:hypothetical protein
MSFPQNTPSARLLELAATWKALGDIDKLKGLTSDDYAMIGDLIVLFGYIDFNLLRLAEAFDNANLLPPKWRGKTAGLLRIGDVSTALQSSSAWAQPDNVERLRVIEGHRKLRNLFAHCAVRRFPEDDAFLFMFKSKRDFVREFGREPEPGIMVVAINDAVEVRAALKNIEQFQSWLAEVTAAFIEQLAPTPIIVQQ